MAFDVPLDQRRRQTEAVQRDDCDGNVALLVNQAGADVVGLRNGEHGRVVGQPAVVQEHGQAFAVLPQALE